MLGAPNPVSNDATRRGGTYASATSAAQVQLAPLLGRYARQVDPRRLPDGTTRDKVGIGAEGERRAGYGGPKKRVTVIRPDGTTQNRFPDSIDEVNRQIVEVKNTNTLSTRDVNQIKDSVHYAEGGIRGLGCRPPDPDPARCSRPSKPGPDYRRTRGTLRQHAPRQSSFPSRSSRGRIGRRQTRRRPDLILGFPYRDARAWAAPIRVEAESALPRCARSRSWFRAWWFCPSARRHRNYSTVPRLIGAQRCWQSTPG